MSYRRLVVFSFLFFRVLGLGAMDLGLEVNTQGFGGWQVSAGGKITDNFGFGGFYQGSALMHFQGDFDSGELGFYTRLNTGPVWWGWLGLKGSLQTGWGFQTQTLGQFHTVFSRGQVQIGYVADSFFLGSDLGWHQTWGTIASWGSRVKETFEGLYPGMSGLDQSGIWGPSGTVFQTGVGVGWTWNQAVFLELRGGAQWHRTSLVQGFEGMMFGLFPFYGSMGIRWEL